MKGVTHTPNYRYNAQDYMRRSGCNRPAPSIDPKPAQPCQPVVQPEPKPACCDDKTRYDELSDMPIAMAYVPWQEWRSLYEAEKGFHIGTIFEELDKPFKGIRMGGCCR